MKEPLKVKFHGYTVEDADGNPVVEAKGDLVYHGLSVDKFREMEDGIINALRDLRPHKK